MPGAITPHIQPPHKEIGQQQTIAQTPSIGASTLDEQIQLAANQCNNGDQAACSRWMQLTSLKGQMTASGQTQAGSTTLTDLLQGGTTTGATAGNRVANPFDPKFFTISGYNYNDPDPDYPDGKHHGIDYGLPSGTSVYAMMQGTAHVYQDKWLGNVVEVRMANGQTARYAHLGAVNVRDGQQVSAGIQLALSNATGNVKGAHLHFEILDSSGKDINPETFLQSVFSGTAGTQALPDGYYTIDGHFIANGSPDDVVYKMAQSIWRKEYGTDPPYSIVQAMRLSGAKTVDDLQAIINAMPSSIPGVNIGVYNAVNGNLQKIGSASFGRPMSQALLKQFLAEGITTPEQMQAYFDSHPASQIPQDTFQQIYDLANQTTQGVWGAAPTLEQVAVIAQKAGVIIGAGSQAGVRVQGPASHGATKPPPPPPPVEPDKVAHGKPAPR